MTSPTEESFGIRLWYRGNFDMRRLPRQGEFQRIGDKIINALNGPGRIDPESRKGRMNGDVRVGLFYAALEAAEDFLHEQL